MGGTWDRKCSETGTLLLSASPTAGSSLCRLAFATLIFMKQITAASAWTTRPTTGLMFPSQFPGGSDGPAWVRWPLLSQPAVAVGVTWHSPVVRPNPCAGLSCDGHPGGVSTPPSMWSRTHRQHVHHWAASRQRRTPGSNHT